MCLPLNLRGVNNTLNYPKDTQLNTPSPRPRTCDTALRVVLHGDRPAQPCNFFYPIDFVVKHPVAPEISPVPTLGWVRTAANFLALLKDQHPKRCSSLNSRVLLRRRGNCRSLGFARDDKVEISFTPCHWLAGAEALSG